MPTTDPLRHDLEQLARAGADVRPADPAFIRERGQARRNKRRAIAGASIAAVFIAGATVGSFLLPTHDAPLPAATPSTAVSASPQPTSPSPQPSEDATVSTVTPSPTPSGEATASTAASKPLKAYNLASASELEPVSMPLQALEDVVEGWPTQSAPSMCVSNPSRLAPTATFSRVYGTKAGDPQIMGLVMQFESEDAAKQAVRTINEFYDTCEATVLANGHKEYRSTLPQDMSIIDGQLQAKFGSAEAASRSVGHQFEDQAGAFDMEHAEIVRVGNRVGWYLLTGVSVSEDLNPNYGMSPTRSASWSLPFDVLASALAR